MTTVSRLSTIFRLHIYYIQSEILRSVVFVGSCFFVCWSVGWLVRSFVNILPTAAMAGWGAFSSCTYLLCKPSYSKFTVKIFRYHGNGGRSETHFATAVKLGDNENPLFGARIVDISLV